MGFFCFQNARSNMSRRERLRRKNIAAKAAPHQSRQQEAQTMNGDDQLAQAVVTRRDTVFCPVLNRHLTFTAFSIGEHAELGTASIRYYRVQRLTAIVDELKVLRDAGVIDEREFDLQVANTRAEMSNLSLNDLPMMSYTHGEGVDKRVEHVPYTQWFMATQVEGQVTAIFVALRDSHPDLTRHELDKVVREDHEWVAEAAVVIRDLSTSLLAKKSRRRT